MQTVGLLQPPSGDAPPTTAAMLGGEVIELLPLAQEICRRYAREFPDERARYGPAGQEWCVHDNLHLLAWAFQEVRGYLAMNTEVAWLASVLEARDFPLERLARTLEIGAEVVRIRLAPAAADAATTVSTNAAAFVRTQGTFVD